MSEMWKDVVGYEGYYMASSLGKIKSLERSFEISNRYGAYITMRVKEKYLRPSITPVGYHRVTLCKDGNTKTMSIHRLVLEAFVPNTRNLPQINHISGDKNDNSLENLEWCDQSHNQLHAYRMGLNRPTPESKKTSKKLLFINKHGESFEYPSIGNASKRLSIKRETIRSSIKKGEPVKLGAFKGCKFILKPM